eukprot:TRINITY_DN6174_c1_g1_i1.p2 TRINITY_DN6174_c1_g1~~TRINITY_DN6174_c1_g1_i1.p2  ORF type:complete len:189 (+),score=3.60 TRINITY_DN6174_c1_g1_i1:63-569(+)
MKMILLNTKLFPLDNNTKTRNLKITIKTTEICQPKVPLSKYCTSICINSPTQINKATPKSKKTMMWCGIFPKIEFHKQKNLQINLLKLSKQPMLTYEIDPTLKTTKRVCPKKIIEQSLWKLPPQKISSQALKNISFTPSIKYQYSIPKLINKSLLKYRQWQQWNFFPR